MINGMSECTHFEKSCCVYILHGVAAYILGGVINNFREFKVTLSADKFEKYSCSTSKSIYQMERLKFSRFQNQFMKSSFLPKYERNIVRISALALQDRNLDNLFFIF